MSLAGASLGLGLDHRFGEPPLSWHPVARYGQLMLRIEHHVYRDRRSAGLGHLALGVLIAGGSGLLLQRLVGRTAATAVATTICAAGKMLDDEARAVGALLSCGDLPAARDRVGSLVGRDTDQLDESELSRAVIESVGENCVDAVTSTVFWAVVGGAPAVLVHRAVNTLDAMVGHRNQRYRKFGWASARADDIANFVPARLTSFAVIALHPTRGCDIARAISRDAPAHPSPNGGVIETAMAVALGVQLGGINRYEDQLEHRGTLGHGRSPRPEDIEAAIRLRRRATVAVVAVLAITRVVATQTGYRHTWPVRNRNNLVAPRIARVTYRRAVGFRPRNGSRAESKNTI